MSQNIIQYREGGDEEEINLTRLKVKFRRDTCEQKTFNSEISA